MVETRKAYIGLWSYKYPYETQLFIGEILQRKGNTQLQSKRSLYGDKEGTRTIYQHKAPKRLIMHQLWK